MAGVCAVALSGSACGLQDDSPFGADTVAHDSRGTDTGGPPTAADTSLTDTSLDPGIEFSWVAARIDSYLGLLVATPHAYQRFSARLELNALRAHAILGVARTGADGVTEDLSMDACVSVDYSEACASVAARDALPGEWLTVRLRTSNKEHTEAVRVPTGTEFRHHAIALAQTSDGTVWTGTPHEGLVGVTPAGASIRYAGVDTRDPWDPHARGPQSGLVLAVEPATGGALWIGSATTGVSYFDPGHDPVAADDDLWIHGTPGTRAAGTALELAETPTIIRASRAGDGAWVGTLNGLFHIVRDGFGLRWTHLAEGPVLALAEGRDGLVWIGSTTELAPESRVAGWSTLGGALIAVDPADGATTAYLADTTAVLAILPHAPIGATGDDDTLWLGTPRGLFRFHAASEAGLPVTERMNAAVGLRDGLAVVQLAPDGDGAFWLAARSECTSDAPDKGQLIKVALADDGEIAWATDYSDAGFGEHAFNVVRVLPGGDVAVSTLVPQLRVFAAGALLSGDAPCSAPLADPSATADTYLLTPTSGALARRLGE